MMVRKKITVVAISFGAGIRRLTSASSLFMVPMRQCQFVEVVGELTLLEVGPVDHLSWLLDTDLFGIRSKYSRRLTSYTRLLHFCIYFINVNNYWKIIRSMINCIFFSIL